MEKGEFLRIFPLTIRSKADAFRYALELTMSIKDSQFELNFGIAKDVYDFFCGNVKLPDVENGNIVFVPQCNSNASMSCDPNFLVDNDGCAGNPIFNEHPNEDFERIYEQTKKYSGNSESKEETAAKTYEDVAKELFFNDDELYHYIATDGSIKHSTVYNAYGIPTICTSRKQAEKLLAINKLLNVAKYLNGDWQPKFYDGNEKKWYIYIDEDGEVDTSFAKELVTTSVYFKSQELAEKAIEILGSHTISLALSTDW